MGDISVAEGIAMFVAVAMAMALVSYLLYGRMVQSGLAPQRRREVLLSLWLLVLGLIALLFALRELSGGPVVGGYPAAGGIWLGLQPRQLVAMGLAIVLLIFGYMRIRKILQVIEAEEEPVVLRSETAASAPDEET